MAGARLPPTPAVRRRRPSSVTNVLEKLHTQQLNQVSQTSPTSGKKRLKLFSLGPRFHQQKNENARSLLSFRREIAKSNKEHAWGPWLSPYTRAMEASPCGDGLVTVTDRWGVQREGGCKGIDLDNSMHLGC